MTRRPDLRQLLATAVSLNLLRPLDRELALQLMRFDGTGKAIAANGSSNGLSNDSSASGDNFVWDRPGLLGVTMALTSQALSQGHLCLQLSEYAGKTLWQHHEAWQHWCREQQVIVPPLPDPATWRARLCESEHLLAIDHPQKAETGSALLYLDTSDRVYLARYYQAEQVLYEAFAQLTADTTKLPAARLRNLLQRHFGDGKSRIAPDNRQALAALSACQHRFCTIIGGPGTGKTTTVTRILAMLTELSDKPLRMALAAPTGKAAARLTESVTRARLALPEATAAGNYEQIPAEASTLHRLLQVRGDGKGFHFNQENPLNLDLLLIDEVSMVDVQLMKAVLLALPRHSRLILLGDGDQLASVEAGNVLEDLCRYRDKHGLSSAFSALASDCGLQPELPVEQDPPPLTDRVIRLTHSYRFHAQSGIGHLARAVNEGDAGRAATLLSDPDYPDIQWHSLPDRSGPLPLALLQPAIEHYAQLLQCTEVTEAMQQLERYRILCAVREGTTGVDWLNRQIETRLQRLGHIRAPGLSGGTGQYHGRPVMITHNDYQSRLFNGDTGLIWRDSNGNLRAWFYDEHNELRSLPLFRLPAHETVYAMTIHKSQGSEFDHAMVILPERDQSLLSRELLYTGITRARETVTLAGSVEALGAAVQHRTRRMSGLGERLWRQDKPCVTADDSGDDRESRDRPPGEQLTLL